MHRLVSVSEHERLESVRVVGDRAVALTFHVHGSEVAVVAVTNVTDECRLTPDECMNVLLPLSPHSFPTGRLDSEPDIVEDHGLGVLDTATVWPVGEATLVQVEVRLNSCT